MPACKTEFSARSSILDNQFANANDFRNRGTMDSVRNDAVQLNAILLSKFLYKHDDCGESAAVQRTTCSSTCTRSVLLSSVGALT